MSSQIQITGETKVKSLTGVLVGTSGVVSSLNIDGSLGIPQLDVNGKIIVSQLPNSVMEYKGTWDASTNTPTLVNGTGNQGDVYLCSVAGTVNFGAGAISFVVSDQVIYSGSIWQKASGTNGTVTSVAVTETGDSLNITGSPITTSGTINIGFNGTNLQYINGAGDLTTFPTLSGYVTSVTGTAPVVSSGGTTPAISMAAATTSVNGYLASADFTTFNNKQNAITLTTTGTTGAATLVGATLNIPNYGSALTGYVPYTGATQDVDLGAFKLNAQSLHIKGTAGNGHLGLKHQSASPAGSANESLIFADVNGDLGWQNGNLYLNKFITSANTANRSYTFPNATGTVALLESTQTFTGTNTFSGSIIADGSVLLKNNVTTYLAGYVNLGGIVTGYGFSVGLPNGGTPLINQLIFNSSAAYNYTFPAATGTLALTSDISYPVTSVFGRTGAVVATNGDYTTAQVTEVTNLYFTDSRARLALSLTTTGTSGAATYNNTTGVLNIPQYTDQFVGTVTSVAALTIGTSGTDLSSSVATSTTTPVITLNVPTASAANRGALSSADWTTFNSKQATITLTTIGTSGAATFTSNTLNIPDYGSALSGYLPLTGGTLTGALSGTSATFSSSVAAGGTIQSTTTSTNPAFLSILPANANATILQSYSSNSGFGWKIQQEEVSTGDFRIFRRESSVDYQVLNLARSTGAATFSSSVGIVGAAGTNGSKLFVQGSASCLFDAAGTRGISFYPSQSSVHLITSDYIGTSYYPLALSARGVNTDLYLNTSGNVGIGTSSPSARLTLEGSGTANSIMTQTCLSAYLSNGWNLGSDGTNALIGVSNSGTDMIFLKRVAGVYSEAMRITSGGLVNINDSSNTYYATSIKGGSAGTLGLTNTNTSGSFGGIDIIYSGAAPNDTAHTFIYCVDTSAVRFKVTSNGGIANFQANDVNLSDERTKKDIIPLESYWDKFKAIEIVKFKYKDQTHDDFNIGVIAQQVESIAPEFIDVDGFGETPEDGIPFKTVYTSDLHHATIKVLQEAMTKIEEQQIQIQNLQEQINAK